MTDELIQRHVMIQGDVGDISFRDALLEQVATFGVTGWAFNTGQGVVEALIEGDERSIDRLVKWLIFGPAKAEISDGAIDEDEPATHEGFEIR